jgi:hypothetical protein
MLDCQHDTPPHAGTYGSAMAPVVPTTRRPAPTTRRSVHGVNHLHASATEGAATRAMRPVTRARSEDGQPDHHRHVALGGGPVAVVEELAVVMITPSGGLLK